MIVKKLSKISCIVLLFIVLLIQGVASSLFYISAYGLINPARTAIDSASTLIDSTQTTVDSVSVLINSTQVTVNSASSLINMTRPVVSSASSLINSTQSVVATASHFNCWSRATVNDVDKMLPDMQFISSSVRNATPTIISDVGFLMNTTIPLFDDVMNKTDNILPQRNPS